MTNGLTVAAPFGGGGVSDVTYDTANAEEMQVLISGGLGEAETGGPSINIVPKSGGNEFRGSAFYSTSGDWATSNNVDDRAARASASRSRPRCARTGMRAAASAVRSCATASGSSPTSAAGPTPRSSTGSSRTALPATRRTGITRSISRSRHARRRRGRSIAGRLTAQITPRNRVTFSHDYQRRCGGSTLKARRRRLPSGGRRLGRVAGGRSAPIPCRRKHSPATTTSRTTRRRPRIRPRSAAAR